MDRLADLQRQIDEATEEVRHLTQDEQRSKAPTQGVSSRGIVQRRWMV
jgi:hypothetical protein